MTLDEKQLINNLLAQPINVCRFEKVTETEYLVQSKTDLNVTVKFVEDDNLSDIRFVVKGKFTDDGDISQEFDFVSEMPLRVSDSEGTKKEFDRRIALIGVLTGYTAELSSDKPHRLNEVDINTLEDEQYPLKHQMELEASELDIEWLSWAEVDNEILLVFKVEKETELRYHYMAEEDLYPKLSEVLEMLPITTYAIRKLGDLGTRRVVIDYDELLHLLHIGVGNEVVTVREKNDCFRVFSGDEITEVTFENEHPPVNSGEYRRVSEELSDIVSASLQEKVRIRARREYRDESASVIKALAVSAPHLKFEPIEPKTFGPNYEARCKLYEEKGFEGPHGYWVSLDMDLPWVRKEYDPDLLEKVGFVNGVKLPMLIEYRAYTDQIGLQLYPPSMNDEDFESVRFEMKPFDGNIVRNIEDTFATWFPKAHEFFTKSEFFRHFREGRYGIRVSKYTLIYEREYFEETITFTHEAGNGRKDIVALSNLVEDGDLFNRRAYALLEVFNMFDNATRSPDAEQVVRLMTEALELYKEKADDFNNRGEIQNG